MGDVLKFVPDAARRPTDGDRRLRIGSRVMSLVVGVLFCLLSASVAAILVLGLAFHGTFISIGPGAAYLGPAPASVGVVSFGSLPALTRCAYGATLILDTAPVLCILAHLRALLRLYAAGHAFGAMHGVHVVRIATGLCAYAVAPLCGHLLVVAAGRGVDQTWFDASEVHALILAAVLLLVSKVMDVGHEAQRDADGFV